jgi:hypothetical protein
LGCDHNGDGNGDPNLVAVEHTGPGGAATPIWSSIMHAPVTAGQTYYVQLGGVGGAPFGHYVLTARVNPAIPSPTLLSGLSLSTSSVTGGATVTGTVTLSTPAPAGGAIVALSDSGSAASVATSVVIPAGATTADFTVQTAATATDAGVTITGAFEGRSQSASLTVTAG